MMQTLFDILQSANDLLWSYIVITMLIGCALLFTFRSRGIQFRLLTDMFRVMADKPVGKRQTGEPDDQGDDKKATTKTGANEELERLKKSGRSRPLPFRCPAVWARAIWLAWHRPSLWVAPEPCSGCG